MKKSSVRVRSVDFLVDFCYFSSCEVGNTRDRVRTQEPIITCTWATKKIKTNETKSASYVWTNHVYIFKIYILISSSANDNSEGVLTHN